MTERNQGVRERDEDEIIIYLKNKKRNETQNEAQRL